MSPRLKDIILSSAISIGITIIFGYYFLYVGTKQREPTFYVDPVRTTIIDKSNVVGAPLLLLRANGDTISSDVVSVYFYFFNQGEETIKHENVYAPLKIKVGDKATILDYKMLKTSRDVSGISLSHDTINNAIAIQFKALEKDDGFAGQIIFEGDKNASVQIEGGIDGTKEFSNELTSIPPFYFLVAIFLLLVAAYILLLMNKRNPRAVPKFLFFFSALPVLYLLLMLYKTDWFIDHKVPETLRSEQYVQQRQKQVLDLPAWFK
jgi:hypothetical protein